MLEEEASLMRRISLVDLTNKNRAQMVIVIEKTKYMDTLYLKHKMNIFQIQAAVKEHGLEEDRDIVTIKQANM